MAKYSIFCYTFAFSFLIFFFLFLKQNGICECTNNSNTYKRKKKKWFVSHCLALEFFRFHEMINYNWYCKKYLTICQINWKRTLENDFLCVSVVYSVYVYYNVFLRSHVSSLFQLAEPCVLFCELQQAKMPVFGFSHLYYMIL